MRLRGSSVASRGAFNLVSQTLNSGGNLLLALMVARNATPAEFGAWAISYVGYVIALSFTRSMASMPMMLVRISPEDDEERRTVRGGLSVAAVVGLLGLVILCVVGLLFPAGRLTCWAFAVTLPGLLVQDAARYVFFRSRRPQLAAWSDTLWLVLQVAAFACLMLTGRDTAALSTIAWGLAGAAGAGFSLLVLRIGLSAGEALSFTRNHRWVSNRLVVDAVLVTLSTNALPVVVASVAGLAAAGALRAAQTVMGGVSLVTAGLTPTMTVESVRKLDDGGNEYSLLWRWCLIIAVAAAVYGVIVLSVPDALGERILGENWLPAEPLLLALVIQASLRGPFTGVPIILRARNDLNGALLLRAQTCVPALLVPAACAYQWGAVGAAWGIAAAAVIIDVECLLALRRRRRLNPIPLTQPR